MAESSRAAWRKQTLENIEREQKVEEDGWRLTDNELDALTTTFSAVQTEYHDLDGLVWSNSDTRLNHTAFIRPRYTSLPSSPSPKVSPRDIPRKKPMTALTNRPLPPIPPPAIPPKNQKRNGRKERSPAKGLFDIPVKHSSPSSPLAGENGDQKRRAHPLIKGLFPTLTSTSDDTIRPFTSRGRERARLNFPASSSSPSSIPSTPDNAQRVYHPADLDFETPRPGLFRCITDSDATVRAIPPRPSSSLGFNDDDDERQEWLREEEESFQFDGPGMGTIRPPKKKAGLGLGIL